MDVVTVDPGTDAVMPARELMGRHTLRHLPVVEDGKVVRTLIEQTGPRPGLNFGERSR